jgi:hypothetical protein
MLLGQLDVPQPLLDAHRDGGLVVFVGAGVSRPAPTSIPTFRNLAERIGLEAGVQVRRLEPLDVYLGRAAAMPYPVHERVVEIINSGGGTNRLHDAVVGLFRSPDQVRIVTTNFDRQLWHAASGRWSTSPREYVAPALPFGGDMRGIVYLHGAAHDPASDLVVTDRDFGLAYLTRGHATRFLLDLYAGNTVLFVGYSHSDPILTYLARGLAPGVGSRYALSHPRDRERWQSLSVTPIEIPSGRGIRREVALARGLRAWGEYHAMGFSEHQHRLREIVRLGPRSPDREAMDYVRARIEDPTTVDFFCREAKEPGWLTWLAEEPLFRRIFAANAQSSDGAVQRALSFWLADSFVVHSPMEAMQAIVQLGTPLPLTLWEAIARALRTNRPRPEELRRWIALLLAAAPRTTDWTLVRVLEESRPSDDDEVVAALFEWLAQPVATIEAAGVLASFGADPWRAEMAARADPSDLLDAYRKVIAPRPEAFARLLLPVVGHHLGRACAFYRLSHGGTRGLDRDSSRRSAIEPHSQDERGGPDWSDVLVDCGRDLLEWACQSDPDFAAAVINEWVRSEVPLLRRLAVHAVSACPGPSADQQIAWLIEHQLLFARATHHEAFSLLRSAYPRLGEAARQALLAAIDKGSTEPGIRDNPDLAVRVRFDRVDWLLQVAPEDRELLARRAQLLNERPEMASRTHPDFLMWTEGGFVPEPSTTDVQDVLDLDPTDPATIETLLAAPEPTSGETFLSSWGERVAEAARERPAWGLDLAEKLADMGMWDSYLWGSLAEAWGEADLGEEGWARALNLIERHTSPGVHLSAIARLLDRGLRSSPPKIPAALLPKVEALAYALWPLAVVDEHGADLGDDWLARAINHPAGELALVMLQLISLDRPTDGHLDVERRASVERVIGEPSETGGFARAVFASQLHLLLSIDRTWALATVLPWFDRSRDPLVAKQAWDGFLTWGRLDPDVASLLLPAYRLWFGHQEELGKRRDRFAEHLAVLPFLVDPGPIESSWLFDHVRSAGTDDLRDWARHVGYQLEQMPTEARARAFRQWIASYWRLRVAGRPRPLRPEEAARMLRWALRIDSDFESAVHLATAMPVARPEQMFVHELRRLGVAEQHPVASVALLTHALRGCDRSQFWECRDATDVAARAARTGQVSGAARAELVEQLLRLGCPTQGLI